jgi:intraflagellar transport protein 52
LNKDELVIEKMRSVNLLVLAGSRAPFSEKGTNQLTLEIRALEEYITNGGNVLIMYSDGGEYKSTCNLNALTEKYKISVNNDCVVRTCYYKYYHPKEALI